MDLELKEFQGVWFLTVVEHLYSSAMQNVLLKYI